MKKKIICIIALCLSLEVFTGCKDYLQQVPLDSPATGQFFNNQTEMNAALTAVYKSAYWNTGNTPYQSIMDGWTDLALLRAPDMGEGNFDVFNANVKSIWTLAYTTIQRANTMIEGMQAGRSNVPAAAYNRMQAEAKGLRAFAYFYLVNMYGDVPLITKPLLPDEFYTQLRAPKSEVIKFIYEDLDAAAQVLDWSASDRGRISKAVVLGIKARTAFYNKDYKTAAELTRQIIEGAGLGLNPKFQDLFTKAGQTPNAGKEIMFEVLYTDADANSITYLPLGSISRTAGGQSGRFPQQRLVDMFEAKDGKRIDQSKVYDPKNPRLNRDMRLKYTVAIPGDTITMNQSTFVYDIYKNTTSVKNADGTWSTKANADFDNAYGPSKSGVGLLHAKYTFTAENAFAARVNFILMRYAEILLTYAESKIELNELDASVIMAINLVRQRAGQPQVEASVQTDQNKLRQLIRRERTVELAMEGFRWFDIRRWDIASIVMPEKIVGIPKDPAVGAAAPDFTTNSINDLNNIPTYAASESSRMLREIRYWYPKLKLLPIPQSERDINPKLTQNPEW
ncbi:Starch-binding associating with outer membrane [Dyadobacter koreensis]|uniref:Starch-binding associating with outer membrane n=1 Tax=Dyadobacter koreensis TaxID=408657 RepID=A0A1H6QAA0_9BACT|nr:RagB/SusD family nutrient uptake outer membrane protein [Dyadobacter koreensis]SEI40711.1 Starch-binding associating with outer membrane [Dyadobacter koreensis]